LCTGSLCLDRSPELLNEYKHCGHLLFLTLLFSVQDAEDAEREEHDAVGGRVGWGGVVMCSFRLRIVHDIDINDYQVAR
jgi:hypothetical protein